mgnify:CR=1 FL=1
MTAALATQKSARVVIGGDANAEVAPMANAVAGVGPLAMGSVTDERTDTVLALRIQHKLCIVNPFSGDSIHA